VLPPASNPLRIEIEQVARARDVQLHVAVEVEGIRLIADLVAANAGVAILPETAIPPELTTVRIFTIADFPPRRLALVSQKASPLSLADQAVRETVLRIVADARGRPPRTLASTD
jgi:DNA-binding transcriptional LysR family regulator